MTSDAAADSTPVVWKEQCVRADWDGAACGNEYLSLAKGELLRVRCGLDDGWALGYSIQRGQQGLFPQ